MQLFPITNTPLVRVGASNSANSALSPTDQERQRPVTALSESDAAENDVDLVGRHDATDTDGRAGKRNMPKDQFQPGEQAVEQPPPADPALGRLIREDFAHATPAAEDAPLDQMAFRASVIAFLKSVYLDDPAFERALKAGTIVVRAVADDGDADMQPQVTYTIYRSGALQGDPPGTADPGSPLNPGRNDFIAWWPQ